MRTRLGTIVFLVAAVAVIAACSSKESALVKHTDVVPHPLTEKEDRQQPAINRPTVASQQEASVAKRPQTSPMRRKILSMLEKKNYRRAVELMNGRNHEGLEKEYIQAINGLIDTGEHAFSQGNYLAAARAYKKVLDSYPAAPSLRELVSRDPKQIRSSLEKCGNFLMEQGLQEYRRGKLEKAISTWKTVLMVRPDHREARQSLDTATIQLRALHNIREQPQR